MIPTAAPTKPMTIKSKMPSKKMPGAAKVAYETDAFPRCIGTVMPNNISPIKTIGAHCSTKPVISIVSVGVRKTAKAFSQ
jgi:hypothetical protein